jgi:Flp pilus assembly protein TadD
VLEILVERIQEKQWQVASVAMALGVVALAGLVQSATRQRVWKDNPTLFAQMLLDAPLSYRAHWANGARLFEAGKPEQGENEMQIAIALFPRDADLREDLASRYFRAGLCVPAVPAFQGVLTIDPDRTTARMGLAACLLRQGDYRGAAAAARSGPGSTRGHPELERLAVVADSLAGTR